MYFSSCALSSPAGGLEPVFVDHRGGADAETLRRRLADAAPEVVVVFRPEIVAPGLFDDLDGLTLGFSTEPLPRDAAAVHPDQLVRMGELSDADASQFDRIVTFDPLSAAAAAAHLPVWRSLALPVDDRFYAPVGAWHRPPRPVFVGFATEHRERFLIDAKHEFDVLHVAWGLHGDALRELFARTDIALNVHHSSYPSFENRVLLHLAAGHLVISEPLSPHHGLRPGVELLEARTPQELRRIIRSVRAAPEGYDPIRRAGRRGAERFRASRVWPRLIGDLVRDVACFGSPRRRGRPTARNLTAG
jgi:glycosyl transferase family 1